MDEGKEVYCVHVIISDEKFGDIELDTSPTTSVRTLLDQAEVLARKGYSKLTYHKGKFQFSDWSRALNPSTLEDLACRKIKSLTH